MFLCIQFPFTDLRDLLDKPKLNQPIWPRPDYNRMVRYFGPTSNRKKGGIHVWSDEAYICQAKRGLRLLIGGKSKLSINGIEDLPFQIACRRFNADGKIMAKFEFGLYDDFEDVPKMQNHFKEVLEEYVKLPVKVPIPAVSETKMPLYQSGQYLKELYLKASTSKEKWEDIDKGWVQAGEPLLLAVFNNDSIQPPNGATEIVNSQLNQGGIKLFYYQINVPQGSPIRSWLIGVTSMALNEQDYFYGGIDREKLLRGLRLNLFRLNAEKEAIRQVLNAVTAKEVEINDRLEFSSYVGKRLNKLTSNLLKENRYNIEQKNIVKYALQSVEEISPGEIEQLDEDYQEILESVRAIGDPRLAGELEKKIQIIVGDNFENIHTSTIVNRSTQKHSTDRT